MQTFRIIQPTPALKQWWFLGSNQMIFNFVIVTFVLSNVVIEL